MARVTEHFGYAVDKRYLPVLLPFLLRPAKDGVTLSDEGSFVATFGLIKVDYQAFKCHRCPRHFELPLVDGGWRAHVAC